MTPVSECAQNDSNAFANALNTELAEMRRINNLARG
jgi:hypothetical protein